MVKKIGTTHIYNALVKSYGVFAERPTNMDMYLTTEAYPEGASPGISMNFKVGKFNISTFINVYSRASKQEEDRIRVMLNISHDDHKGKEARIYSNEGVANVLSQNFMQDVIFKAMAEIDKDYAEPREVILHRMIPARFNLADAASAFQKATKQYGYASWHFNNYQAGGNVSFDIALGTPDGQVQSRSRGDFQLGERVPVIREKLEAFLDQATSKYTYAGNVHKL